MSRGYKPSHPSTLEMPEGFDSSGVPGVESFRVPVRPAAHRRHHRSLPGLAPAAIIATAEEVAERGDDTWLIWGNAGNRPLLFAVPTARAAEMMDTVAAGETATAIVEPWQVLLERLD